ncbi:MAG TPA: low molecular weight protein-tyrosine-phosphatase [Jiangellaceae bacterium]|nr:low molecular weight protein-tyrosine-phosphatase [Jiangellaceae bacterium]
MCLVCLGNICRSPMAATVLRQRLSEAGLAHRVTVESGGTGGWHVGGPADPRALVALDTRGYRAHDHVARQFTAESFAEYDLILAMDRDNFAELSMLAPDAVSRESVQMLRAYHPAALAAGDLDVRDPYYGPDDGFDRVLDQVVAAVDGLVEVLRRELTDEPRAG